MLAKDQKILDLNKEKEDLTSQVFQAKKLVEQTYVTGWDNAVKQAKYFFAKNGLNFGVFNSTKFLEEMLRQEAPSTPTDEGKHDKLTLPIRRLKPLLMM